MAEKGDGRKGGCREIVAFHGKRNNLTLEGGFQTRRSVLKLIAKIVELSRRIKPPTLRELEQIPTSIELGIPRVKFGRVELRFLLLQYPDIP